jgi:hypothetical protein
LWVEPPGDTVLSEGAMSLPLPEFYRPEHVGQLYLERAALVA